MVMAVMSKFFPAPGASDLYCNKPHEYDRVTNCDIFASLVSNELLEKLNSTGISFFFEIIVSV